eukprot:3425759-Rhodomonas_salina.1
MVLPDIGERLALTQCTGLPGEDRVLSRAVCGSQRLQRGSHTSAIILCAPYAGTTLALASSPTQCPVLTSCNSTTTNGISGTDVAYLCTRSAVPRYT